MGCLCTPAVAAIRLVPTPGGGFHIVFTTPPSPPAPPPARVPPHPAWLKPSYLLGTWKIVGKWGMTGGEVSRSWHKLEEEQIGRTVVFTKTNIHYKPPFLAYGIGIDCAAPPRYTVKVIPIHIRDVVLPKSYLQWSGPPGRLCPLSRTQGHRAEGRVRVAQGSSISHVFYFPADSYRRTGLWWSWLLSAEKDEAAISSNPMRFLGLPDALSYLD